MENGSFEGLRVVDLTSVVVGPVATQFLADYGADVIKVEAPSGDLLRMLGGKSKSGQLAPKFLHFNRSKRSIVLDLKTKAGREALQRLLRTADVCVTNMRPAALARLGLDADKLVAENPQLIVCRMVGFGQGGRYRDLPAYDSIIQASSGVSATFTHSAKRPRYVPMTIADHIVGIIASQMITLALYHRERSGEGQVIDVPMFENMAAFVMSEHLGQHTFVPPRGPFGDARVLDPRAEPIATADGYIAIAANTDPQAFALFEAMGMPELRDDPRFSSVAARYLNVTAYFEVRAAGLAKKTTAEWLALLTPLDVPAAPCHSFDSLLADGHLADVGLFRTIDNPIEGKVIDIDLPNKTSVTKRKASTSAPLKGEHTGEVLREIGYSPDEIAALVEGRAAYCGLEAARVQVMAK